MNQVILVGRLTSDPEIIITEKEKKMTAITIAVARPFKNIDGIYEADFIRCILWNNIALNTCEYCHTGDIVGNNVIWYTQRAKNNKSLYL